MTTRRHFLSAVSVTAATAALPRMANAAGGRKLALYANTGRTLMQFDVDVENATLDRKSTRLNSSHVSESRMPSSA